MKFFISLCLIGMLPLSAHAIPSEGHQIMISAPSAYAVEVGKKIAAMGGNVADVAVAVGLTLNVTTPYYAAMGGGGFALVKMNKDAPVALDFRETAPQKTAPDFYTSDSKRSSQDGGAAVGVPGNPMGLYELHKKYGKLPWKTLFALPVKLAEEGFQVSGEWVDKTSGEEKRFSPAGIKFFFKKGRKAYLPGEVMRQPQLAKALRVFRDHGPQGVYSGAVAKDIAQTVQKNGGVLSEKDLSNYKVRWLKPLMTHYNGYEIYLMPPPSSGGVVIAQALSMITSLDLVKKPFLSVDELHLLGEIQSRAFRGRALLADPDFHKNPLEELLNESSLKKLAKTVNLKKAVQLKPVSEPQDSQKESTETTHFVVMDDEGNAVTLTTTLNGNYGSGVVSEKFGIALNNEMDDFTTHPGQPNMFGLVQGQGNVVEPGKRPLSSMSPTLAMKDGKTILALGAPGGPRIISSVLQVLYRVLGQNMDLDVAVQAPRVHHQYLPNVLYVDKQALSPLVIQALEKRGHKVEESWMAKVYAVQRDNDGVLKAAFDHRGEGAVGGY